VSKRMHDASLPHILIVGEHDVVRAGLRAPR
jgi:hypothetical protein